MDKQDWVGALLVAILGFFGIGVGIRRHNQRKQERIDEEKRLQRKRDKLTAEIQRNQILLQESQKQLIKMMKKMNKAAENANEDETEVDPLDIEVDMPE